LNRDQDVEEPACP